MTAGGWGYQNPFVVLQKFYGRLCCELPWGVARDFTGGKSQACVKVSGFPSGFRMNLVVGFKVYGVLRVRALG